ncbi:hypothetical protein [Grimontia hollisae]|uniref:hypothetical protein n=1 Tax=Grimontia hollisae TaxID=673 RepID=UPI001303752D|nr:hypothetical protein [Grimontia hollisae]
MNSDNYTAPSQWVNAVISALESRLNLTIDSAYYRDSEELTGPRLCYHTGEVEPVDGYAHDGRKQHDLELRFLCYVPLSLPEFELEALDMSCRLMRELQDETFGNGGLHDTLRIVSNMPRKYAPESGFFLRVVTVKQMIRMGPLRDEVHQITGTTDHVVSTCPAD